jgi:FtsP/CotA-like multicopper oxidase with cupredoxin domain
MATLVASLSLGVVFWEYLLHTLFNPYLDWNPRGLAAHLALDGILMLPVVALALWLGRRLARRLDLSSDDLAGVLGTVGITACVLVMAVLPLTSSRDLAHEWLGTTWGLSMAEVQTTVVRSDLTVSQSTQLCSFGAVRNPSLARGTYQAFEQTVLLRVGNGLRDAMVQQAAFLPLLMLAFFWAARHRLSFDLAPLYALLSSGRQPLRLGVLAVLALLLFGIGYGDADRQAAKVHAQTTTPFNACTDGGPVKEYDIHAIDVTITLNRWGDHVTDAYMYALEANIPAIREFEAAIDADRDLEDALDVARVSAGLRKDPIQPLAIRANLGECLRINFTNDLSDGQPASMHILGLPHKVESASSAVGNNPDTFAQPGQTLTYEIPIPDDVNAERAYYFHDHGAGRRRQNMGLFGAIVAEPKGATYLDVETGEPLDTATGSNWEAVILDPNPDNHADGKSFREFVIFYHEIGDEAFTDIRDRENKKLPLVDDIAGVYRPAARALNYRSEPFRRRLEVEETGKALGYSSYSFGDPATPIPRSYVGEGVKTRLMHGGSEVFHVHHLHGGGDRWRRNPNADANNDFWKGLTKVPDPNLSSIHLDSQSIGPGTSYNLEHECGAGGCQQGVGEFLFHCHIGHHYISGMWSFWRVFGTDQTAMRNFNGRPLAVVPELFQNPANPLSPPAPPALGVSAGELIGLTVDDGRTLVADSDLVNSNTQMALTEWITTQLPPAGERLDKFDATVWNWTSTGADGGYQVWGEPESDQPFAGYVSATPSERPEVLFNPKNGRYTWPLFRPQMGQRPPFTARHSGAPWLGEEMKEGRLDGLCAKNGVDPNVDVGNVAKRFYPVSSITLPIQITADKQDPNGQIFVLNEEEAAVRNGDKPAQPLAIRSNVGDCVEIVFTNKIPDSDLNKDFSKTNIHSHFVQFDTQASDGVITGFSYEQAVRPIESEGRTLTSLASAGSATLSVNHTDRLRPGIWLGIGLGEGTCGTTAEGQPKPCTEIRQIAAIPDSQTIVLDSPLDNNHAAGEAAGVEFVRYHWYSDVDFGTVFYHTHVEFKDWDHGLFGTHIVEPKGSTYHDPQTGEEVRSGTLVDIRVDPGAGGNPVAAGVEGSFREFMLFLHNNNPVEGQFTLGGGTINLRAEPWRLREGEPTYRFSSVTHGDPHTPTVRAYVGDPVVVRGMGLVERVGGVRFTGHRFQKERVNANSDTRDATFLGISERFDVSLEGGAGGPAGYPGDFLYYSTVGRDFESGAWGLLRVHDTSQGDLQPLPDRATPAGGSGFPQLATTGEAPPSLRDGPGDVCPDGASVRSYSIVINDASIIYNELSAPDNNAVVYQLHGRTSTKARTPMVMRANAGECLRVDLRNARRSRSSLSLGELLFDPQRSYGSAVGYNYDSTALPGWSKRYEYYADRELGLVLGLNLANVDTLARGAFAGVVVEPAGSEYFRPGSDEPLPAGGVGIQADVVSDGVLRREFVALFNDEDRRIGQNAMPYPVGVERFAGINYAHEPLDQRDMLNRPSEVFKSAMWGDPRYVVEVPAGTPLVYRVGQPWGEQIHVPTLEGHRFYLDPDMPGSEQVYNDVLIPGVSRDFYFVGGAGGDIHAAGDYLFLDRRQPFLEFGLWNILRVTDGSSVVGSGGSDSIAILDFVTSADKVGGTVLEIVGRNSIRPAGDTAEAVGVYAGGPVGSACRGRLLGRTEVDPGSGEWRFSRTVSVLPSALCVRSTGGGVLEMEVGP